MGKLDRAGTIHTVIDDYRSKHHRIRVRTRPWTVEQNMIFSINNLSIHTTMGDHHWPPHSQPISIRTWASRLQSQWLPDPRRVERYQAAIRVSNYDHRRTLTFISRVKPSASLRNLLGPVEVSTNGALRPIRFGLRHYHPAKRIHRRLTSMLKCTVFRRLLMMVKLTTRVWTLANNMAKGIHVRAEL